jgi:hypothetical protein
MVTFFKSSENLYSLFCANFLLAYNYYATGLIWSEIKQLWDVGFQEYAHDMWNVIDFVTNSLYVATVALRIVSYYKVSQHPGRLVYCTYVHTQRAASLLPCVYIVPGLSKCISPPFNFMTRTPCIQNTAASHCASSTADSSLSKGLLTFALKHCDGN